MSPAYLSVKKTRRKHRERYNRIERLRKKLKRNRWYWKAFSKIHCYLNKPL